MANNDIPQKGVIPPPKCKAILLCERTIIDAGTGKVSLIDLFNGFLIPEVPGHTCPFMVFLLLTEGVADHNYQITVEIHDLSDDKIVARATGEDVKWGDRLAQVNLFIPVPPLPIKHPGLYDFVVFANNQEIDRQKFGVNNPPNQEIKGEDENHE
ncbi:MAG: hypothetical protein ABSA16_13875 [Thermoguttaceae bacterium]|jgi:hypothetical protein